MGKLKELLVEFMDSNAEAISLCQKNLPPEQAPLFQEIKNSYNTTRENLKKYVCIYYIFNLFY